MGIAIEYIRGNRVEYLTGAQQPLEGGFFIFKSHQK